MTDAPPIQYAKTSDGVNIAYWTYGNGPPLVLMPLLIGSHVQLEWSSPARRAAFEGLAQGATVIRYDCRGMGMSDREPVDFSVEAATRDLEAVVDRLGLERFAVLSQQVTGQVGLAYATQNPDRVTALAHRIMMPAPAQRSLFLQRTALLAPLADQDWEMYSEVIARLLAGWNSNEASAFADIIRSAHTPASLRAAQTEMLAQVDNTLRQMSVPVLLLHTLGDAAEGALARQFAGSIPNCHVVAIPRVGAGFTAEGAGTSPYPNEIGLTAILDFIAAPEKATVEVRADGALRTILFTDLVDHTQMMTRLGDEKGRDVLREHERITREALKAHGGSEVKSMGDGFMASFGSVTKAVECAVAIQRGIGEHQTEIGGIQVRIGLNAGEPIEEEGDLFGSTVILAARIASIAEAGEILVSDVIRQLLSGKPFLFNDRGEHALKGFEDPVRVYEVSWRDAG